MNGRNDWVALDLVPATPAPSVAAPAAEGLGRTGGGKTLQVIKPQEKSIEEKLTILKNLREKNLITEQEYIDKKREILDSF